MNTVLLSIIARWYLNAGDRRSELGCTVYLKPKSALYFGVSLK